MCTTVKSPTPRPVTEKDPIYMRNPWLDGLGIGAEARGRNSLRIDLGGPSRRPRGTPSGSPGGSPGAGVPGLPWLRPGGVTGGTSTGLARGFTGGHGLTIGSQIP